MRSLSSDLICTVMAPLRYSPPTNKSPWLVRFIWLAALPRAQTVNKEQMRRGLPAPPNKYHHLGATAKRVGCAALVELLFSNTGAAAELGGVA